jgi:hypothetical protein
MPSCALSHRNRKPDPQGNEFCVVRPKETLIQ